VTYNRKEGRQLRGKRQFRDMLKSKTYELVFIVNNLGHNFVSVTYTEIMHRFVTIMHSRNACADAISITEKKLRNSVH
jgi:hypothetical protein